MVVEETEEPVMQGVKEVGLVIHPRVCNNQEQRLKMEVVLLIIGITPAMELLFTIISATCVC